MEPRKLLRSSWAIPQLMNHLVGALSGNGPAIAFGSVESENCPENIAIVIATSGSTGKSKEVAFSACALIESARLTNEFVGAKPGDRWSLLVSENHAAGVNVLIRSLELGTLPITDISAKADFTAIVPTQLFRALNGENELLQHLKDAKAILIGGSAVDEQLLKQGRDNGLNLITTYGMTETSGGCVYDGKPLPGVEIKIGKTIEIKSPTLAANYLNNQNAWNEKFKDDYFITDDLGVIENGILKISGRVDDVIISGGKNISLSEIERLIKEKFEGIEVAAFGTPDVEWGQSLNIAIVGNFDLSEMENVLQSTYRIKAKRILKLAELPRSALGKIDRSALINLVQS